MYTEHVMDIKELVHEWMGEDEIHAQNASECITFCRHAREVLDAMEEYAQDVVDRETERVAKEKSLSTECTRNDV
jgi:hypothetical protein